MNDLVHQNYENENTETKTKNNTRYDKYNI